MDKLREKLEELTPESRNLMLTTFIASMLATFGTNVFLSWTMAGMGELTLWGRLFVTLGAVIIYSGIACGTFFLFLPEKSKLAFKKIWIRRK